MMISPSLAELPSPPPNKHGWPWTEDSTSRPTGSPGNDVWPRVSIITPSYNQVLYIEETIRSVLLQGYPNLEYIIIDGGSTDGSVDIIRKYEPWLAYWVSEQDAGQSDALNKGFHRASGEIVAWLNSDDTYLPGVLTPRAAQLANAQEAALIYGDIYYVNEESQRIGAWNTRLCTPASLLLDDNLIPQPSVLMRANALAQVGYINPGLHYTMDYELWCRLSCIGDMLYEPGVVASFRHHTKSKSVAEGCRFVLEILDWISKWPDLDQILSQAEKVELRRRLHIKAAVEFTIAGRRKDALDHFSMAFRDGVWPFGDLDALAIRVVDAKGLTGQVLYDSWERMCEVRPLLESVLPHKYARLLWRRISSRYHMRRVFQPDAAADAIQVIKDLLRGVWADPRWLRNRGVWSIARHSFYSVLRGE